MVSVCLLFFIHQCCKTKNVVAVLTQYLRWYLIFDNHLVCQVSNLLVSVSWFMIGKVAWGMAFMCPFAVALDGGRYFLTAAAVSSGHDVYRNSCSATIFK